MIKALLPEKYLILCLRNISALTSCELLTILCRPFFERALPMNIGIVPNMHCEGSRKACADPSKCKEKAYLPISDNHALIKCLLKNHCFELVQDGCHHDYCEFFSHDRQKIIQHIEEGKKHLLEAGLGEPKAFFAPQDKLSSTAFLEIAKHFALISLSAYDGNHLPKKWLLHYAWKQLLQKRHWRIRNTLLLSHILCRISQGCTPTESVDSLKSIIAANSLSVLSFEWWESSQNEKVDQAFLDLLCWLADYIVKNGMIKVIVFSRLIDEPLFFENCA